MSERQTYRDEIQESVSNLVTDLPEWDADPYDKISEVAENWTIYTSDCYRIMRESSNEDAGFDHMGSDALSGCDSFSDVVTRLAYFAVYQDLVDELAGWSDEDKLEARDESICEDCGEARPNDEMSDERPGRDGDHICDSCYDDWQEDQEDEDDEE